MNFPHPQMAAQLRAVAALFGTSTVSVRHVESRDEDSGAPVYGAAVTFTDARVEGKVQMIRTGAQETNYSSHQVYVNSSTTFNPDDEVTLPDASVRLVLAVSVTMVGEDVVETVLFLG